MLLAITLRDAVELGYDPSTRLWLRELEVDRLFFGWNLDTLDLFQFLDPALHLLRLRRLIAEATDERLQLLDPLALIVVGRHQRIPPLLLLSQIFLVIPRVEMDLLVPDLCRLLHRHIEEISVVRDQHVSVGILDEEFFQPISSFKIEVIGRFVQQQEIGFLQ